MTAILPCLKFKSGECYVYQGYYNLAARELEHEIVPLCLDQDVGITVWSPLAGGFLTGKYRHGEALPSGSRLSHATPFESAPVANREQAFDVIDLLSKIAQERGMTVPQVALNWLLCKPGVTSLVIGATRAAQLADNLAAVHWQLSAEEVIALDAASAREKAYPYWHMCNVAGDRRLPHDVYP